MNKIYVTDSDSDTTVYIMKRKIFLYKKYIKKLIVIKIKEPYRIIKSLDKKYTTVYMMTYDLPFAGLITNKKFSVITLNENITVTYDEESFIDFALKN